MAGKLISLEDAAKLLGVAPTELADMRQRQEVYGMRDGSGWKFKQEDIERFRSERAEAGSLTPAGDSSLDLPLDLDSSDDVLLGGLELGDAGPGSSTVIGAGLRPDSEINISTAGSGLNLLGDSNIGGPMGGGGPAPAGTSDSAVGMGSGLDLLGSDVKLVSPSGIDLGSNVLTGSSSGSGADAGKTMLTAELADKAASDSSIKMSMRDSESIFGEPDSDVSRSIEGSGINLIDARDSGLNLDDLQLASSISGIGKKKGGGSDLEMKGEEDFLLTPLEEQGDDSTDSGSQVIALEGDFGDDATATLMAGDVPGLSSMLEDAGGGMGPLGGGMGAPGPVVYAAPPEPSYGIGTVAALGFSSIVLTLVGVMMYDILRNMWSWDTPYSFNSSLIDMILGMFG